jgi:hypothetical protein
MATTRELVAMVGDRYRGSAASAQRRILEEFVALRGYHRTHALRVPNGSGGHVSLPRGPAPRRRQNRGRALVPPECSPFRPGVQFASAGDAKEQEKR